MDAQWLLDSASFLARPTASLELLERCGRMIWKCRPCRMGAPGPRFWDLGEHKSTWSTNFGFTTIELRGRTLLKCRSLQSLCGTLVFAAALASIAAKSPAAELPQVSKSAQGGQLLVQGQPYLILGGELGNSSAGTAEQADSVLPLLARMHLNIVLMPVACEQIEPVEGSFDFRILDHWIDVAREQHIHLVLLWFGSWKNGFSNYAPTWVKADTKRFPRAVSAEGAPLEILSTLSMETQKSDSRAFAALMSHVRDKDREQQTVLMVQVENEVGYLGQGRDRSAAANQLFQQAVPTELVKGLQSNRESLSPELRADFNAAGHTWQQVFGEAADEVFMAWHYARYIEAVAAAGKQAYALPMYANCQLPAPFERAGEYPSGGPHPYYLEVYRLTAPSLDFFSPDIYWPNFAYWINRYRLNQNPVFVPEARADSAPYNALYAYGEAKAFGFSPFGVDTLPNSTQGNSGPQIQDVYSVLNSMHAMILTAQSANRTRALVLHRDSPRQTQTVSLGGYLFEAALIRSWPAKSLLTDDGAMLIVQTAQDEFYIAGSGLIVSFIRDPDVDARMSTIATIEEVKPADGDWTVVGRLNGDQSNQGRQLSMAPHEIRVYRVNLMAIARSAEAH